MEITAIQGNKRIAIQCNEEDNLKQICERNGIFVDSPCNGKGLCGKCSIRVLKGGVQASKPDLQFFTARELKMGYRLACTTKPVPYLTFMIEEPKKMKIEVNQIDEDFMIEECSQDINESENIDLWIGIDIGTTTIALNLVECTKGKILGSQGIANSQKQYGADVISRIEYSCSREQGLENLGTLVRSDIQKGIELLLASTNKISIEDIKGITVSANPTMIHFLLKENCSGLKKYPFHSRCLKHKVYKAKDIISMSFSNQVELHVMPSFAPFVGADIVAGLFQCKMWQQEEIGLFIDIGTNGELAIGNKEKILVGSTAAGPAFEGGNISCGVPSVSGAISSIRIKNVNLHQLEQDQSLEPYIEFDTIDGKVPRGLCGTGVVELIYELLKSHIIDETGLLLHGKCQRLEIFQKGNIFITQDDIRQVQLAKAAIHAGIATLINASNWKSSQIQSVYLAGGFGQFIDLEKAAGIGLLPMELVKYARPVGNTSLKGATRFSIQKEEALSICEKMISVSTEIVLANEPFFKEEFLKQIDFKRENIMS